MAGLWHLPHQDFTAPEIAWGAGQRVAAPLALSEVDGVLIPMNFTQRLEMPQGAFFAEYKVKDVKLNTPIGNDVFAIQ